MSRPTSTLFLVPGFPEDESDTSCLTAVHNYVAAYSARRADRDVHVLSFQYPFTRTTYRWHSVTVHALAGRNRGGIRRLPTWMRTMTRTVGFLPSRRIDVIHSFWLGECTLTGQLLSRLLGIPHVATIGGQDARRENPYLRWLRLDRMTITAGSSFAKTLFEEGTGRRIDAVVPIGIDPGFEESGSGGETRTIDVLGVGSLIPLKRYEVFVDLIASLAQKRPRLRAVLIGSGPEEHKLRRRIVAAGLEGHVRLVGQLPRDEVRDYMRRSRILLHPSEYESQGYVFLEALASGMFVVCRDVGFVACHPAACQCVSDDEMAARLQDALASPGPPAGPVPTIDETVRAFTSLYERVS